MHQLLLIIHHLLQELKREVIIAGTENSCMAGVQKQQYEEFFGGFFFDEDVLRYYHPSIALLKYLLFIKGFGLGGAMPLAYKMHAYKGSIGHHVFFPVTLVKHICCS